MSSLLCFLKWSQIISERKHKPMSSSLPLSWGCQNGSVSLLQLVYGWAGNTLVFSFCWPWSHLKFMASVLPLTGEERTLSSCDRYSSLGKDSACTWKNFHLGTVVISCSPHGTTRHLVPLGTGFVSVQQLWEITWWSAVFLFFKSGGEREPLLVLRCAPWGLRGWLLTCHTIG